MIQMNATDFVDKRSKFKVTQVQGHPRFRVTVECLWGWRHLLLSPKADTHFTISWRVQS